MEKHIKLLLINYTQGDSVLDKEPFINRGFQPVDFDKDIDLESQCLKHDIAAITVKPPIEDNTTFIDATDFPADIPLLWLAPEPQSWQGENYPETTLFTSSNPGPDEIISHLDSLKKITNLKRIIADKDLQLEELTTRINRHQKSVEEHNKFLNVLAVRDGLTGLYNRRHLNTILPKEFQKCLEHQSNLTILIIDIDYFNEINKSGGVSYGDYILNDFAARLTSAVQPQGICFRFSGEIFLSLLPDTSLDTTIAFAESLKNDLRQKPFVRFNERRTITFSAGIVSFSDHQPDDPDEFVVMAEKALFTAKSEGRDRVVCYQPIKLENSSQQNIVFLKQTLSKILEKTRISAIDSLQLLAKDIAGDKNRHHIRNVRHYVELLGRHMDLPTPIVQTFKNAITLHTSIRFLLHNEMINKEEPFTMDDREIMDDFPFKLAEITEMFEYFSNERAILLYHGERFDGSGYPHGLKGDEIPLGARIFSIVDALAAMNADRPHRAKLQPEAVVDELTRSAGSHFDPSLVIKVLELLKKEKVLKAKNEKIDNSIAIIRQSFPDATL